LQEGQWIGRFELRSYLGRGGSGDVYLAWDANRENEIALKLIRIGVDEEMLEAERQGVALQQRLQPQVPQVAAIYDFGDLDGYFYVAMEYVNGVDLSDVVRKGALPRDRALDIAIQLCAILESIDRASLNLDDGRRRVIHGDIKPANIRLQENSRVRLLDFGVAKSLSLSRKVTRNIFGSTAYLTPERLVNEVVDAQTDLWSVCVVLYQMLSGKFPFPGDTEDAIQRRILSGMPPDPLPADCPNDLKAILFKGLRTEPELRFSDAATLRRHLEASRDGRPLLVSNPTRKTSPADKKTSNIPPKNHQVASQRPPEPSRSERRFRRSRLRQILKWAFAGIILLLIAASHGYAWFEGKAIQNALADHADNADLPKLYERYHYAKRFDFLGICLPSASQSLKSSLVASANRILSQSRSDILREDWEHAFRWLRDAFDLDNTDESVQAKLAFCEGQLARIDAETLFGSNPKEAKRKWQEALQSFEKARMIAPELVEVYLALASVYSDPRTGLMDTKKLSETLEEAERRGAGHDEWSKLTLVEVRLSEAMQTFGHASRASGQQKIDLLYDAGDGFEKVIRLCQDLKRRPPPAACLKARENQEKISQKLIELNQV
jgi:serine/threonine protein kinase